MISGPADHVDEMLTPDRLPELPAESDYVVLCVPAGDETRGLIGAAAFAAMKHYAVLINAVLINIARGSIVDEDALTDALSGGRIRGATLNVVREEPPPPESPLWDPPRCVITPHQSSYSPLGADRLDTLFIHNVGCYLDGAPIGNEVAGRGSAE